MKILKSGNKKSGKWISKCSSCGAIVEAVNEDLSKIEIGDYRSDHEEFAWEKCPECTQLMCFHRIESRSGKGITRLFLEKESL